MIQSHYTNNNRMALYLIDSDTGEPVATCTVNTDDDPSLVLIKDYSENEGMLDFLIEEGIVKDTGERISSGYVMIPVVTLEI